jgi:hypothetical protein
MVATGRFTRFGRREYTHNFNYIAKIDQLMNDYMPLTPDVHRIFCDLMRRCEMAVPGAFPFDHTQSPGHIHLRTVSPYRTK